MIWQRFLQQLGLGLLAVLIATSLAVVPPWALSHLWSEVDRASQIGIACFYATLIASVIIYAFLTARVRTKHSLWRQKS